MKDNILSLFVAAVVVMVVGNFIGAPKGFAWTMNFIAGVCLLVAIRAIWRSGNDTE